MCADVVVRADSSSGLAVIPRRGLVRFQRYVWVQQRVQERDFRLTKEPGDTNVSDTLTKPLEERRMTNLLPAMVTSSEVSEHCWRQRRNDDRTDFSSMKFSCGVLQREIRALLGVAAYWVWLADLRQDVDEQIWEPRRQATSR